MAKNKTKSRATSYQVARLAGVSQSAVSRAYNPGMSISEPTRKKVFTAAKKLGYQPNAIARSLISNKSNLIGIVMGDTKNPFYPEVLDLFVRKLQDKNLKTMLLMASRDEYVDDLIPLLMEYRVDGLVITSASLSSEMADRCVETGTPVVLFNRYVADTQASFICCDNESAARKVADYFIKSGHKSLAYIAGKKNTSTNFEREKGYTLQIEQHGLSAPVQAVGNYSYMGGFDAALKLFDNKDNPDAVFCANDIMAMGAMDAIRNNLGLSIPQDVSIIGFDDIANAQWPIYNLTTIRQPVSQMVERTISNLLERAENPDTPQVTELLAGELIVRGTTRSG